jgi:hypothetical protein
MITKYGKIQVRADMSFTMLGFTYHKYLSQYSAGIFKQSSGLGTEGGEEIKANTMEILF